MSEQPRQEIALRHLAYGDLNAMADPSLMIRDINLTLPADRITLLEYDDPRSFELVLGLLSGGVTPTSGELLWQGKNLTALRPGERAAWFAHRAIVHPLRPAVLPRASVHFHTELIGRADKARRNEFEQLLNWMKINPRDQRPVSELADHERWLMSLFMALVRQPELLIVQDAPTWLDSAEGESLLKFLELWVKSRPGCLLLATPVQRLDTERPTYKLVHGSLLNSQLVHDPAGLSTEASLGATLSLDQQGRVHYLDHQAAELLGISRQEMLGNRLDQQAKLTNLEGEPVAWLGERGAPPRSGEYKLKVAKAEERVVRMVGEAFAQGSLTGVDLFIEDVSRAKELERAKFDFAAITSHELRTPLTTIRGTMQMLEVALEGRLDETEVRMMQAMAMNVKRLENLVNNLLRLTKQQEGKLIKRSQDITALVNGVIRAYQGLGRAKTIGFELQIDGVMPAVLCDAQKITEALQNYLSNALDNAPENTPVRVRLWTDAERRFVKLSVNNQGRPLSTEEQSHLFTLFYRASKDKSFTDMHLGLGLYATKQVIEQHGGEVWATSNTAEGTTFGFTLPAA